MKLTRERCTNVVCSGTGSEVYIDMDDQFGDWSNGTGWFGSIECERCGRRVEYVGSTNESKKSVEARLRAAWRATNAVGGEDA